MAQFRTIRVGPPISASGVAAYTTRMLAERDLDPTLITTVTATALHYDTPLPVVAAIADILCAATPAHRGMWAGEIVSGRALSDVFEAVSAGRAGARVACAQLAPLGPADIGAAEQLLDILMAGHNYTTTPTPVDDWTEKRRATLERVYAGEVKLSIFDQLRLLDVTPVVGDPVWENWLEYMKKSYGDVLITTYRERDWWHPLENGIGPRDVNVFSDPRTVSPWKLHIAADTAEEVNVLAARLVPVVVERKLNIKLAGKNLLGSDDIVQRRKGAVIYLPRRATLASDAKAVLAAVSGLTLSGDLPGDVMLAPGVGIRLETGLDPGIDRRVHERGLYAPAGEKFRSPDHDRAWAQLREILALTGMDRQKVLSRAKTPFGDSSTLSLDETPPAGLLDSARPARAMSAYMLARDSGADRQTLDAAEEAAWTVPESDPETVVGCAMTQRIQNSDVTTPEKLAEFTTNVVASVWHTSAQAAPWGPLWSQLVAEEVPSANPKLLLDSAPLLHAIASGPEPSSWLRLHRDGLDGEVLVWARRGGLDPSQVRPTDTDMWEVYREIQAGLRPTPPEDTQEKAPDRAGRKMHPHRR